MRSSTSRSVSHALRRTEIRRQIAEHNQAGYSPVIGARSEYAVYPPQFTVARNTRRSQPRYASSTPSRSFSLLPRGFFGRSSTAASTSKPTIDPLITLQQAVEDEDLDLIRSSCRAVLDRWKAKGKDAVGYVFGDPGEVETGDAFGLNAEEIAKMMDLLDTDDRGSSGDLALLQDIWLHSREKDVEMANYCLKAHLHRGTPRSGLHFVSSTIDHGIRLDNEIYEDLLDSLASSGDSRLALDFLDNDPTLRQDRNLYRRILSGMTGWSQGYDTELEDVLRNLRNLKYIFSAEDLSDVEWNYRQAGETHKASEAALELASLVLEDSLPTKAWNTLIRYEAEDGERWNLIDRMRNAEAEPNRGTLETMVEMAITDLCRDRHQVAGPALDPEATIRTTKDIAKRLGIEADEATWGIAIDVYLNSELTSSQSSKSDQAVESALHIYHEMRQDFSNPPLATLTGLLRAMTCQARPNLNGMQEIYGEVINTWDEADRRDITASERRAIVLALLSYIRCLAGEAKDPIVSVTRVLQEVRDREIKLDLPPKEVADHIMFLMRHAPSHHDAFRVYSFVRALDPKALDGQAYEGVLSAFVTLSTPKSRIAPPAMFFEFMKDMRGAGISPTAKVYSILINQYSKSLRASRLTGDNLALARADALEAVRRAHAYIKLDSFVDVDVALLNSLMDAYNQVGAYRECFDVWDDLATRMRYDNELEKYQPSISIILDACGQGRFLKKAKGIWKRVTSGSFPVNQNNWAAYLECLSRSDQVLEALEDVERVAAAGDERFVVDERILLILLRFSTRRQSTYEQVAKDLERQFPELWPQVKAQVEVPWDAGSDVRT